MFFSNRHAREAAQGLTSLLTLLNEAKADLQWQTEGESHTGNDMKGKIFIGHGSLAREKAFAAFAVLTWTSIPSFVVDVAQLR